MSLRSQPAIPLHLSVYYSCPVGTGEMTKEKEPPDTASFISVIFFLALKNLFLYNFFFVIYLGNPMNLLSLSRNDSHSTESRNNSKPQQLTEAPGCLGGGAGHTCSPQLGLWDWFYSPLSCRWEFSSHELRDFSKGKTALHWGRSNGLRRVQSHGLVLLELLSTAGWAMCLQAVSWAGFLLCPGQGMCVVQCFVFIVILKVLYFWPGTLCTRFWEQWLLKYICKHSDPH